METTKNKLTKEQELFFDNLSSHIQHKLYFYGSIQRLDYIPGKSDIDVDIFTDNESSVMHLMSNFLHVSKTQFKKILYRIDGRVVSGYKVKYANARETIVVEFSIYNNRNKDMVLKEHNSCLDLSLLSVLMLYIIKCFFYVIPVLSKKMYKRLKQWLMNPGDEMKFIEMVEVY